MRMLKRARLARKIAKTGQMISCKPVVRGDVRIGDAFVMRARDGSTIRIVVNPDGDIERTTQW